MKTTQTEELKKDKGCIFCKKFFDCKGKPKNVKECINFEKDESNGMDKT